MGKKCEVCKKKCSGDIIQADDGKKYFHIDCFVCKTCQKPLSDVGYYTTTDGSIVCPEHGRAMSITPLSMNENASRFNSRTDIPLLGASTVCSECGDHLTNGQVLLALERSWHVWCFKCTECAAVLQGEYMVHDGKQLCLRDYNQKYGVKCYECERFIAGRVLEAGGYKFHPTCARCSRCGNHFVNGQEMLMQGNEIWHPDCEHYHTTENLAFASPKSRARDGAPKYQSTLGQHPIYMYLLPESEETNTNLKHTISPKAAQPAQFHTPQAPIKIRKSRMAMLKTGMQRLTEDLEKSAPRPHSPHMDNEEPIEMAHYPNAHQPEPGTIPPIEREDFPAPPYPYAVEEMKRRLSSSSVENDDDETDEEVSVSPTRKEEKVKRTVEALHSIDKDSSIAHVLKQNLEEAQKKQRLPLHWDPRNASRTPSAKKMPHLKFRYDTPINASPSRHLNRPKPWVSWKGDSGIDRAATTALPCFHIPQSRDGTARGAMTMPDGYYYDNDTFNGTISTRYSDHSLNAYSTLPMQQTNGKQQARFHTGGDMRTNLRTSLPDMSKPVTTYALEKLQTSNKLLPEDVDRQHLERHLAREEFEKLFDMTPIEFYKLPEWKRINMKRKVKLF